MLRVAEHFADSDVGRQRSNNEDALLVRSPLFVVADGMGGAQAGEVASGMAVDAIRAAHQDGELPARIVELVKDTNARIHADAQENRDRAGMGCTLTMSVVDGSRVVIGHVGDSRAYRLRDGRLEQITEDHSLVGGLVRLGKLTEEEALVHPQRSVILRALGPAADVDVDVLEVESRDGDLFLLCSDGLTGMVRDQVIEETLKSISPLGEALEMLIHCANASGGVDNITAVAFRLGTA